VESGKSGREIRKAILEEVKKRNLEQLKASKNKKSKGR
jgi:hypothetical protein